MSTDFSRSSGAESFDIVAVASSAGGIFALSRLLEGLPTDFPVPVVVVQHLDPRHQTLIADVLGRRSRMPVRLAEADTRAESGTVFVAPPNYHLLVGTGGAFTLTSTPLVHFVRPSADVLFESVAEAYGPRAIACVLTGTGRDGATGVSAVKARGGTVIVEDPDLAEFRGMPDAAVRTGAADFVLPLSQIAEAVRALVEVRDS